MTPIQTNKHVFFDEAGNILEGGQIYIGQPNTDPRTNPKTVTFTDAGGVSFTASQPLKTVAGRISYNGKPIVAQVDGEHSMLVFDSTGKQTDYYPSIVPSEGGGGTVADFSEVTRIGLTLSDIKAFDVAVGNVVENVGEVVVTDDLGAQWLVVSATGSPGDDVDLIDFTNGLQGRRIIEEPYTQREIVTLGGDFTVSTNEILVCRVGKTVTISSNSTFLQHPSNSSPESASGVIPAWARPSSSVSPSNVFSINLADQYIAYVVITFTGTLAIRYVNFSGFFTNETESTGMTISYAI